MYKTLNQVNNIRETKKDLNSQVFKFNQSGRKMKCANIELKLDDLEDRTRQSPFDKLGCGSSAPQTNSDSVIFDAPLMNSVNKLEEISEQLQQFFYRTRTRKSKINPGCPTVPITP